MSDLGAVIWGRNPAFAVELTHTQLQAINSFWPDYTPNYYAGKVWAANSSAVGSCTGTAADVTTWTAGTSVTISSTPAGTSYAGGGSPYTLSDGSLLLFYHREQAYNSGNFYGTACLARSTNGGTSWTHIGEILTPKYTFNAASPPPLSTLFGINSIFNNAEVGGLSPRTDIISGYFVAYYTDYDAAGTPRCLCAVRALIADVDAAAVAGGVGTNLWKKWDGSGWNENGVGGLGAALDSSGTIDAWYGLGISLTNNLVVVVSDYNKIYALDGAAGGLSWTNKRVVYNGTGRANLYPSIYTGTDGYVNVRWMEAQAFTEGSVWADNRMVWMRL